MPKKVLFQYQTNEGRDTFDVTIERDKISIHKVDGYNLNYTGMNHVRFDISKADLLDIVRKMEALLGDTESS